MDKCFPNDSTFGISLRFLQLQFLNYYCEKLATLKNTSQQNHEATFFYLRSQRRKTRIALSMKIVIDRWSIFGFVLNHHPHNFVVKRRKIAILLKVHHDTNCMFLFRTRPLSGRDNWAKHLHLKIYGLDVCEGSVNTQPQKI